MNRKGWMLLAIIVALGAAVAAFVFLSQDTKPAETPEAPLPDAGDLTGMVIYASGMHGFVISYPETAYFDESVAFSRDLANEWALGRPGFPIVAIVSYTRTSDTSYPRDYAAFVRIGTSEKAGDVAACEKADTSLGEEPLPDREISGVLWKAFSYQDAAMMQYVKGVSYRTVHDGKCYALEKIATGSSYREEPSPDDLTDEALEAEYAKLDAIVGHFMFATP